LLKVGLIGRISSIY